MNEARFAPITYVRYKTLLARINPAIGHMKIGKITAMHLEEFYKNLGMVVSDRTGKPLSPQTIKHHHLCISAILTDATRKQLIPRNVASRQFMDAPTVLKKEPVHLNDEQAQRFVSLLFEEEDVRKKAAFIILIYAGLRIGELLGLEWKDIDYKRQAISIKRTSQFCTGHGTITKAPKTNTSTRTIKLPSTVFTVLTEYRKWYNDQEFILGDKWVASDRLFVQWDGKPLNPTTPNKWLDEFAEKHGFPKITPHSLRHTFVSLLIAGGVDIRTVAHKAGHSRTSTTSDIYSHVIQSADEAASDVLDYILTGNKKYANNH